jgi:transposase-like protein
MTSTNSRIDLLKEAMSIEMERAALQLKLDGMHARLAQIQGALISGSIGALASPVATRVGVIAHRGTLKERILAALASAGHAGMRVKDLAVAIGSKPSALHSWFQFARKSVPAVRKTGPGRYRLVGPVLKPGAPLDSNVGARVSTSSKSTKVNKRGELAESILGALKAAGSKGVTVSEMSRRFDVKPRNLFVWFSTTAKKYKMIKKIGPGLYCIKG